MFSDPLISVIVPIYKVEAYLKKCVDSILAQTYKNIEVILIDDGSPDYCGLICDEYKKIDNRVQVIHKNNGGLSEARNFGIDICQGDYISFVDSDDFIAPYFLECLYFGIKYYNTNIAGFAHWIEFTDINERERIFFNEKKEVMFHTVSSDKALELLNYQKISCAVQLYLYKKELFRQIRFPVGYLYEDLATTYKLFMLSDKVTLVDSDAYAYRLREDSIIRMKFDQRKMICINIAQEMYDCVCMKRPELKKSAATRAMAVNYTVFLQVPFEDKESKMKLWDEIKKYRSAALINMSPCVRIKDRCGAIMSYFNESGYNSPPLGA